MVGGIRDYPQYFDRLAERSFELVQRDDRVVRYHSAGLGTLSFEVDGSASSATIDGRELRIAVARA